MKMSESRDLTELFELMGRVYAMPITVTRDNNAPHEVGQNVADALQLVLLPLSQDAKRRNATALNVVYTERGGKLRFAIQDNARTSIRKAAGEQGGEEPEFLRRLYVDVQVYRATLEFSDLSTLHLEVPVR